MAHFGKLKTKKGEVHINKDICKGCSFCVEFCPRNVLVLSKDYNQKGYHSPIVKNPEDCVDCHLCEVICPEFAIYVTHKEEA
jgi:2-oxoglutarate ferredoxin oxidoreductase subunit delta